MKLSSKSNLQCLWGMFWIRTATHFSSKGHKPFVQVIQNFNYQDFQDFTDVYETSLKGKPEMSSENVLQQHSIPSLSQKHKTQLQVIKHFNFQDYLVCIDIYETILVVKTRMSVYVECLEQQIYPFLSHRSTKYSFKSLNNTLLGNPGLHRYI